MVVGLGIDIVQIARIERACSRPGFLERILTPAERARELRPAQIAGRWAAKEAVAKAVGVFLSWQEVEVLSDDLGAPVVTIHSSRFDPGRFRVLVSISHEREHAVAVAVLERIVLQATV